MNDDFRGGPNQRDTWSGGAGDGLGGENMGRGRRPEPRGPVSRKDVERGAAIRTLTIGVFSAFLGVFGIAGLIFVIVVAEADELPGSLRGRGIMYSSLLMAAIWGTYGAKYIWQGIRHLRIVIRGRWDELDSLD
jgi:hypothetical protein